MPQLDAAQHALLLDDDDEVLRRFGAVVSAFGRDPLFTTVAEFDLWMESGDTLVFDAN